MSQVIKWLKKTSSIIWNSFLHNLGILLAAFIFYGGYLVIINKIKRVQELVRMVPTDYVLTPLVLLIVIVCVLLRINYKQRVKLSKFERKTPEDDKKFRFVTHCGVWWKIYPDSDYIEDFPYCPCCEPKKKLVQVEWYPDEVFKCPATGTKVKLYNKVPVKRNWVLDTLYNTYFKDRGKYLEDILRREYRKLKELHPKKEDNDILKIIFERPPLKNIPNKERNDILKRYSKPQDVFSFLRKNYESYRRYFKKE